MESPDPPRKNYGFKERDFKRDNAHPSALPPMPTAKDLAMMSGPEPPATARAKAAPKPGDPNDVFTVLQQNRAVEQRGGRDEIEIRKVKSRRKRDFWLMLVGGNLLIIGMVAITGFNVVSVIFGLAGIIILSLSLTWIMWQVMDRY
jgi:hypothetical protein